MKKNPVTKATAKKAGKAAVKAARGVSASVLEAASEVLRHAGYMVKPTKNPERNTTKKTQKKVLAWYRERNLVTEPEELDWHPPEACMEIGEIVAIEYASNKFDGEVRVYRHDVTKRRRLFISEDGSTIIIDPPFKVTTRGIEG